MLPDGQTIPVNHRNLKEFIPKLRPDPEFLTQALEEKEKKQETKRSQEMKEETSAENGEMSSAEMALIASEGEWDLNPRFLEQTSKHFGSLELGLYGDQMHFDPEFFESVPVPLREYKDLNWDQILSVSAWILIFSDFKD